MRKWREGEGRRSGHSDGNPDAGREMRTSGGLTLVEVLMSMIVTGIGVLGVIALLPLAFVRPCRRPISPTATILGYNAESMIDFNPRLLLRWQPNKSIKPRIVLDVQPAVGYSARPRALPGGDFRPPATELESGGRGPTMTTIWHGTTQQNPRWCRL